MTFGLSGYWQLSDSHTLTASETKMPHKALQWHDRLAQSSRNNETYSYSQLIYYTNILLKLITVKGIIL